MKQINRRFKIYERCIHEAIVYLNQAIYYIKETAEENGYYPDTFYNLNKLKHYLINEKLKE